MSLNESVTNHIQSFVSIVKGEPSRIEKHNSALAKILEDQSNIKYHSLFTEDHNSLSKFEKNIIAGKMNKFIRNHQPNFPDLLIINQYTLEPEFYQYEQNIEELNRLQIKNLDNIKVKLMMILEDKRKTMEDKMKMKMKIITDHYRSFIKNYNKNVAYWRNHGYPKLLCIDHKLDFKLVEEKPILDVVQKELRSCALTGCDRPDEEFIGFRITRRNGGLMESINDYKNAISASIDSAILIDHYSDPNKTSNKSFGYYFGYQLELTFTMIMKNGNSRIHKISSTSKNIIHALVPSKKYCMLNKQKYCILNEDPELNDYFEIRSKMENRLKLLINTSDNNASVFHCDNSECEYYSLGFVSMKSISIKCIKCINFECNREFCFDCKATYHGEFPCDMSVDEMSASLISNITKPCPNCNVPIQKNEGCAHMVCTSCSQDWCWVCNNTFNKSNSFHGPTDSCTGNPIFNFV